MRHRTVAVGLLGVLLSCGDPAGQAAQTTASAVTTDAPPVTTATASTPAAATVGSTTDAPASPSNAPGPTQLPPTEPTLPTTLEPTMPPTSPAPLPAGRAGVAVADLAQRIGVGAADIAVVRDDEVTWPDGSLGCAQPGRSYTQVLTPGFLIVLSANGRTYEYHGAGGRQPFYCPTPSKPVADPAGP